MKKIFTLLMVLASLSGFSQSDSVDVTFYVSTANITVDAAGLYLAGGGIFGSPGDNPMSDADGNGVYEITAKVKKGTPGFYIFTNGACGDWSCKENLGGKPCGDPSNYNDRSLPSIMSDTVILGIYEQCDTDTVAVATEPSSSAAAPTYPNTDVISLFSDSYTDVTVGTWRTSWSNATLEGFKIDQDSIIKYSALDFVGVEPGDGNFINAEDMHHFNLDFWTADATTFRVKLVDFGADAAYGGGDDKEHELVFVSPSQNIWVNLHLDLDSFVNLTSRSNIAQIIFSALPAGGANVFIDNVFFSKDVPIATPTTAAVDPTSKEADVISLFSGAYTDVTVETWRTDWSNATLEEVVVDGNDVKKYSALNFVGIEPGVANAIDASSMEHFNLDMWTPNATTFRVKLVDFGADAAYGGGDDTEHEVVFENPATETWVNYKIPMTDFTNLTATEHINQIIFSAITAGEAIVYVDNVHFSKKESVGIDKINLNNVQVYPNPVKDNLTVKIDAQTGTINSLELLTLQTESVYNQVISAASVNTQINTSALASGVYILKVTTDLGLYSQRVVVK